MGEKIINRENLHLVPDDLNLIKNCGHTEDEVGDVLDTLLKRLQFSNFKKKSCFYEQLFFMLLS
jgi:hypothetical protein